MRRALIVAVCVAAGCGALAIVVASAAPSRSPSQYPGCRYDHRQPLAADIHQSYQRILARAERVLRRSSRSDRASGLPQLLAGSPYHETGIGPFRNDDGPGYHRRFRLIGATVEIAIDRPHPADAAVLSLDGAWPRNSPYYRYSRHLGYIQYRSRLTSPRLESLILVVDVRRERVVSIIQGPDSGGRLDRIPDGCPPSLPSDED